MNKDPFAYVIVLEVISPDNNMETNNNEFVFGAGLFCRHCRSVHVKSTRPPLKKICGNG